MKLHCVGRSPHYDRRVTQSLPLLNHDEWIILIGIMFVSLLPLTPVFSKDAPTVTVAAVQRPTAAALLDCLDHSMRSGQTATSERKQ